jgi:hypothetical protein
VAKAKAGAASAGLPSLRAVHEVVHQRDAGQATRQSRSATVVRVRCVDD